MAMIQNTRRWRVLATAVFLAAAIALAIWLFLALGVPPRTVTLATGPEGGSYAAIGESYRTILALSGFELRLVPTAGDVENLAKLRDARSGVSAGFVIAGLAEAQDASGLESLGTIAYEPFWLFERTSKRGILADGLAGKRVSFGQEGSGTRAMARKLLALAGIDTRTSEMLDLTPAEAAERLVRGDLDAVALVADWDSPAVRRLVASPQVSLIDFRRADAWVALNPNLSKLVLPAGVGDLAANRPPADVTLIAPKASLVVRGDLHKNAQYLLLDAASRVHSRPGIFHLPGAFPGAESIDFPLSDEAVNFYKSGRPFLHRHLPFWAAVRLEGLLILLIPVLGLVVPLVRLFPGVYRGMIQRRIAALYGGLKLVELEIEANDGEGMRADMLRRLDDIERRANRLRVPLRHSQMLYTLKSHIRLVRDRVVGTR
jgi:TRAP transporter TAXI family solute receptor